MTLEHAGLWAVVTNWNGGAQNLDCVASLIAEGFSPERIVFVDNGSKDGSLELVRVAHPELCFLENEANEGFALGSTKPRASFFPEGWQFLPLAFLAHPNGFAGQSEIQCSQPQSKS